MTPTLTKIEFTAYTAQITAGKHGGKSGMVIWQDCDYAYIRFAASQQSTTEIGAFVERSFIMPDTEDFSQYKLIHVYEVDQEPYQIRTFQHKDSGQKYIVYPDGRAVKMPPDTCKEFDVLLANGEVYTFTIDEALTPDEVCRNITVIKSVLLK